jgi:hypothetical protein
MALVNDDKISLWDGSTRQCLDGTNLNGLSPVCHFVLALHHADVEDGVRRLGDGTDGVGETSANRLGADLERA